MESKLPGNMIDINFLNEGRGKDTCHHGAIALVSFNETLEDGTAIDSIADNKRFLYL